MEMLSWSKPQQHFPEGSVVQGQLWWVNVGGRIDWFFDVCSKLASLHPQQELSLGNCSAFCKGVGTKLDEHSWGISLSFL